MSSNNPKRVVFLPLLLALAVICGILIGIIIPSGSDTPRHSSLRARNDKITGILNIIESNYVDTVNRNELADAAIPAMLKKLDPHSVYIPAKEYLKANEPLKGNFEGIGISFSVLNDTILIVSTIPGGPSEKLGIMAGDKIIYVNDSLVAGKNVSDERVMGMLKGPRGTVVRIRVLRNGHKDLISYDITRDKIPIYSVDVAYMVDNEIGYIKISSFAINTFDEFMKSLRELKQEGMTKLIVDLRGNSGGIMDAAIQIANEFLKDGELIVYTKGRKQPRNEARATGKGEFENGDLVLLIDEWSASASEILAGAIQDNDRGTIIGRRSFGKGLVQEQFQFSDGSGLRLTTARYYTPSGRSIQRPYDKGYDAYFDDWITRNDRHELEVADSIHFNQSLKFTTPKGKVVYGGGGIMPDKFVPIDTSDVTPYFLRIRPLIYQFALKYTETNREKLKNFTTSAELEKYLDRQDLPAQLNSFVILNKVKPDYNAIKISGNIINVQMKGYIARNLLDNKGAYPIWEKIDYTLRYAIDFLEKDAK